MPHRLGSSKLHEGHAFHPVDASGVELCSAADNAEVDRAVLLQADIIRKYGVRAVIGKGGMGVKTLAGLLLSDKQDCYLAAKKRSRAAMPLISPRAAHPGGFWR